MTASAPRQQSASETLALMSEAQQANRKVTKTRDTLSPLLTQSEMIFFFSPPPLAFLFKILMFEDSVALGKKQQPQDSGLFQMLST